jgi:stage II sporulation protein D
VIFMGRRKKDTPKGYKIIFILMILTAGVCYFAIRKNASGAPTTIKKDVLLSIEVADKAPTIALYDSTQQKIIELDAESYIVGTVAAEMPALFDDEALKAQAIACRTWLYKNMKSGGCGKRDGADICSDYGHCQAWENDKALRQKWGENYNKYYSKILNAVSTTRGQIMTHNGEPIRAYYHSVSGGKTENVAEVFGGNAAYLISVDSPGEERAPSYKTEVEYTFDELYRLVRSVYPEVILTHHGIKTQLKIISRDASDRVSKLQIGKREITGVEAREMFKLGSANFTIDFMENKIKFTSIGHGHGVGMSQYGADSMAKLGTSHDAILKHYYVGVELNKVWE